ncbi:MAG: hypothetical protein RL637_1633 [Pseudomonadota bacterium]|jgi:hypothetical protein
MKACESCQQRVHIAAHHQQMSVPRRAIGLLFVYLPILTLPFVITSAYLTYFHLRMVGAKGVKTWSDFMPDRASHRYDLKNQITMDGSFKLSLAQSKLYWILNCTWYCPLSVALFEWHAYLVKVVENWWCPFAHNRKNEGCYNEGAIDRSFWHLYPEDKKKLHTDDLNNPLWNESESEKK